MSFRWGGILQYFVDDPVVLYSGQEEQMIFVGGAWSDPGGGNYVCAAIELLAVFVCGGEESVKEGAVEGGTV